MKTPEQWMEIMNKRGSVTQPAGTLKLIADIQEDALNSALQTIQTTTNEDLLLICGELSRQELRTARALLKWVATKFHSGDRDNTGLNRRGLLSAAPMSPG